KALRKPGLMRLLPFCLKAHSQFLIWQRNRPSPSSFQISLEEAVFSLQLACNLTRGSFRLFNQQPRTPSGHDSKNMSVRPNKLTLLAVLLGSLLGVLPASRAADADPKPADKTDAKARPTRGERLQGLAEQLKLTDEQKE